MARKSRRYDPLRGEQALSLGTLAAGSVAAGAATTGAAALGENYFVNSIDLVASAKGFAAGEGPLVFGICHADYSDPEIEEWIESTTGSYNPANLQEQEVNRRKIRRIGMFPLATGSQDWNDGRAQRIKLNWQLHSGNSGLQLWAYNTGTGALTSGGVIEYSTVWHGRFTY